MKVRFRWAMNSPLQPLPPVKSGSFQVEGKSATFSYDGAWALLRLLRINQASLADFPNLEDPMPITLSFTIPLTNVVSNMKCAHLTDPLVAKVFLSLKVMPLNAPVVSSSSQTAAGAGSGSSSQQPQVTPGTPVSLPYFPYKAPLLDNSNECKT